MNNSTFPPKSNQAFTLVELLVVIAILGILIALATAGIGRFQDKAYISKTVSNLRQLYAANQLHAADQNGFFVPLRGEDGSFWLDNRKFQDYLGVDQNGWDDWPTVYKTGDPNANAHMTNPAGVRAKMSIGMALGWDGRHWIRDQAYKSLDLANFPRMVLYIDARNFFVRGTAAEQMDEDQRKLSDAQESEPPSTPAGQVAFRYGGNEGGLACFIRADGTAETATYEELFPSDNEEKFKIWPRRSELSSKTFPGY